LGVSDSGDVATFVRKAGVVERAPDIREAGGGK
jgi:hypothetical protein